MAMSYDTKPTAESRRQPVNGRSRLGIAAVGLLLSILAACAGQNVRLNPTLQLTESDIGRGIEVSVTAVDLRTDKLIGYRYDEPPIKTGKITLDQNLAELFSAKITEALASLGFSPAPHRDDAPLQLRIDIRQLKYNISGFWYSNPTVASIKVTVTDSVNAISASESSTYEKVYRYEIILRTNVIPGKDQNEELLNDAVAGVMRKLIADQNLIRFILHSG